MLCQFCAYIPENCLSGRQALFGGFYRNKEFYIGNYHFFEIRDPKVRTICASSFPERVLHHAVINVCGHVFDSYLIHDTYACRKDKGNLKALERASDCLPFRRYCTEHFGVLSREARTA
jgi:hypothetical protein